MRHVVRAGVPTPIAIHAKEYAFLDVSADAIGTVSVDAEGISQTLGAGGSYSFGGFIDKRVVMINLTQGTVDVRVSPSGPPSGGWTPLTLPYTLTAADDGKAFAVAAAGTLTVPSGLSPRPSVVLMPPPSGSLSVTGTLNGSSQTLTRTRANNFAGVALNAYQDADGYGLSGA